MPKKRSKNSRAFSVCSGVPRLLYAPDPDRDLTGAESFAFRQPTPAAWRRWLAALTRLAVPKHRKQLGTWLVSARSLLRAAPVEVREELCLRDADLEDGQGVAPPAIQAGAISHPHL